MDKVREAHDTFMRLLYSKISQDEVAQAHIENLLAVLEEARGCAGHFAANPPGSCVCASCAIRNSIKELGGNDGQG